MRHLIFLLLTMAGCAPVPRLGVAPVERDVATLPSATALRISGIAELPTWPDDRWWRAFADPQLDALMSEALRNSPDVAVAAARLASAEAIARQAAAARSPLLSVDGQIGGNKQSENLGIPRQFLPNGIQDTGRLTATATFDLDLWGRSRAALRAARGDAAAAAVDAAQARLMLTTAIASAYAELAQAHAQRTVATRALKVRQATATLTAQRVQVGSETRGGQAQAEARVPQARADLRAVDEAMALTRYRLAALVGAGPDRGLAIAPPSLGDLPAGIPAGAGVDLLGRRPDIVAARLRAAAAGDRIKVARADFYPNISIGALVGLQSLGLGKLFDVGSSYGNGGLAASLPILDAGRVAGRYRGARAGYDAAVAQYDATLITALREVAEAATSRSIADARLIDLRAALAFAQASRRVAELRYRGGLANQLPVLAADDTQLAIERAVADLQARRTALDIALIRALGGGYRELSSQLGAR